MFCRRLIFESFAGHKIYCLVFRAKQHIICIFSPRVRRPSLFIMLLLVIFLLILTIPLPILPLHLILLFSLISSSSPLLRSISYRYPNCISPFLYVLLFTFPFCLLCLILLRMLLLFLLLYLIFLLLYVISASIDSRPLLTTSLLYLLLLRLFHIKPLKPENHVILM